MQLRTLVASAVLVLAACAAASGAPRAPRVDDERPSGAFGGFAAGATRFAAGESAAGDGADGDDGGWALSAGYRFTPWFAVSGGYTVFGELAAGGATESVELDGLPLLFHGILPVGERVALVGTLGGMRWSRRVARTGGGSPRDDELGTSPGFGLGVHYDLNASRTLGLQLLVTHYLEVGDSAGAGFDNDVTFATVGLTLGMP